MADGAPSPQPPFTILLHLHIYAHIMSRTSTISKVKILQLPVGCCQHIICHCNVDRGEPPKTQPPSCDCRFHMHAKKILVRIDDMLIQQVVVFVCLVIIKGPVFFLCKFIYDKRQLAKENLAISVINEVAKSRG